MTKSSMVIVGIGAAVLGVGVLYLQSQRPPEESVATVAVPPDRAAPATVGASPVDSRGAVIAVEDVKDLFQQPFTRAKYEEVRKRFRSSEEAAYGPLTGTHLEYYRDDVAKVLSLTQPLPAAFEQAINGDVDALVRALDDGTPVDSFVTYKTPDQPSMTLLDVAIEAGQREVIRMLLARGADPNPKTIPAPVIEGIGPADPYVQPSPLALAAGKGEDDVVELLLKHGASVDQGYDPTADPMRCGTPLCSALASNNASTAYLLLMRGASIAPLLGPDGTVRPVFLGAGGANGTGANGEAIEDMLRASGALLAESNGP